MAAFDAHEEASGRFSSRVLSVAAPVAGAADASEGTATSAWARMMCRRCWTAGSCQRGLQGAWGWSLFGVVWTAAVLCIGAKLFNRLQHPLWSTAL